MTWRERLGAASVATGLSFGFQETFDPLSARQREEIEEPVPYEEPDWEPRVRVFLMLEEPQATLAALTALQASAASSVP